MKKSLLALLLSFSLHADYPCATLPDTRMCTSRAYGENMQGVSLFFKPGYWQIQERGLDFAISNKAPSRNLSGKIIEPHFSGEFAFKLGGGYELPYDGWDISGYWTRFRTDQTTSISATIVPGITVPYNGIGLLPIWVHPGAYLGRLRDIRFGFAQARWKCLFNAADFELQRSSCLTKEISSRFLFGVKSAWIQQNFDVIYLEGKQAQVAGDILTPLAGTIKIKNRSWGIGPKMGIQTRWHFFNNLALFSHFSGALLFTQFKVKSNELDSSSDAAAGFVQDRVALKEDFWTIRPTTNALLGLDWGGCFCLMQRKSATYIYFSIAYEVQYWWKQNEMRRFVDQISDGQTYNNDSDLYFHGVSGTVSLTF